MSEDKQKEVKAKQQLDQLERHIEECRREYELYFMGIEKREPGRLRDNLKREIALLRQSRNKQSAFRFRLNSLASRFQSLSRYWDRINYEREQGIFRKDKMRTRRRVFQKSDLDASSGALSALPGSEDFEGADTPPDGLPAFLQGRATAPKPKKDGLPEDRMRALYDSYIDTRRQCNENANVSYKSLVKTIEKQIPRLREKGYNDVDFKVVVRDGKAALKPIAKK